ncbi:transcriptional regulator [Mangrovactinospora gilvigrisea]|uniref:Transcriptional regulator n=1 Tax=Mangrovactinospora gilvigrisea TaxID=1428644 RepID=A0A1J7CB66_9ACTN|nr:GAF and ANTAR domain-containing protein [Mangrovactinospora gilvigrisea]OIV38760.1 transcriptional regulator [Mangrovactinospora gilvigrisea]
MAERPREERITNAFVELADTLVGDFDAIHFLDRLVEHCLDLLDIAAAGVILATPLGDLMDAAATDRRTRALEEAGLHWGEGPLVDCYRTGRPVANAALDDDQALHHWPRYTLRARRLGFVSHSALPLRLRAQTIGALSLYRDQPGLLDPAQLSLGQALADIATIGILQQHTGAEQPPVAVHLHAAMQDRLLIEQAIGFLAERADLTPDESFVRMRTHSRAQRRPLTEVARQVLDDAFDAAAPDG